MNIGSHLFVDGSNNDPAESACSIFKSINKSKCFLNTSLSAAKFVNKIYKENNTLSTSKTYKKFHRKAPLYKLDKRYK